MFSCLPCPGSEMYTCSYFNHKVINLNFNFKLSFRSIGRPFLYKNTSIIKIFIRKIHQQLLLNLHIIKSKFLFCAGEDPIEFDRVTTTPNTFPLCINNVLHHGVRLVFVVAIEIVEQVDSRAVITNQQNQRSKLKNVHSEVER
jgi:hypothetical protein